MLVDKAALLHHWLKHHFKFGLLTRMFAGYFLEFLHMNDDDHLDLRFSSYQDLRVKGVACIKDAIFVEDLLLEWQNNRWNPFRFADPAKQVGYLITFSLSTFCWIVLLVYTVQFANEEEYDLASIWQGEVIQNIWMDVFVLQPLILVGSTFATYELFKACFPKDFTSAEDIRTRDALDDSLYALLELTKKQLCEEAGFKKPIESVEVTEHDAEMFYAADDD